jgi:hypothetical protein
MKISINQLHKIILQEAKKSNFLESQIFSEKNNHILLKRIIQEEVEKALFEADFGGFGGFGGFGSGGDKPPAAPAPYAPGGTFGRLRSKEDLVAKMKERGFTDEEIEEFLKAKNDREAGRTLKKAFAKRNKQKEWQKMIKVHWVTNPKDLVSIMKGANTRELSVNLYHTEEQLTNYQWGTTPTGIILDGHITIAGNDDIFTVEYYADGEDTRKRKDTKYSTHTDQITFDPSGITGDRHNEGVIDHWRIKGFLITPKSSDEVIDIIEKSGLPYTRIGSEKQKNESRARYRRSANEVGFDHWFNP